MRDERRDDGREERARQCFLVALYFNVVKDILCDIKSPEQKGFPARPNRDII
jgi:hypothetical protein